jgi:hypothetical protein
MKLYDLVVNEELEEGVEYIALVDRPATESDFIAFKLENLAFKVVDEEKRIVSGYFMIADKEIYRNDNVRGEHLVKFTPETIATIQLNFMKSNQNTNVNLMHSPDLKKNDIVIFEHIIIDSDRGIAAPKGFNQEPNGSWFGSMYIPMSSQDVWEQVKDGKFKGFSVEGFFSYKKEQDKYALQLEQLKELLKNI